MSDRYLRISPAAMMIGVHPQTLRKLTAQGQIACMRSGPRRERRYLASDLTRFAAERSGLGPDPVVRRAILYLRVSGTSGQETSLASQEEVLRATCARDGVNVALVVIDRASGLNEHRRGIKRILAALEAHGADEVRVTHADRLARFGVEWLRALFACHGATLVIEHVSLSLSATDELLSDFMALVASFSNRLYGQRSIEMRRRLLDRAQESLPVVDGDQVLP
jgi:predicted site-specific integrase-resolvase